MQLPSMHLKGRFKCGSRWIFISERTWREFYFHFAGFSFCVIYFACSLITPLPVLGRGYVPWWVPRTAPNPKVAPKAAPSPTPALTWKATPAATQSAGELNINANSHTIIPPLHDNLSRVQSTVANHHVISREIGNLVESCFLKHQTFMSHFHALMFHFLSVSDFCWKDSYTIGVGTIPTGCGGNRQLEAGLCYEPCKVSVERLEVLMNNLFKW